MTDDPRRSHDTPRGKINVALSLDELTRPPRQQLSEKSSLYVSLQLYNILHPISVDSHVIFNSQYF